MSNTHPKFIKIITSCAITGSPQWSGTSRFWVLYGLTEDGRVFEWDRDNRKQWEELGTLEKAPNEI